MNAFCYLKNKVFFINKLLFLSLNLRCRSRIFVSYSKMIRQTTELMTKMRGGNLNYLNAVQALQWILIVVMMGFSFQVAGQGWERNFGGNKEDQATALIHTRDGGFLIVGHSESFGPDNDWDIYLIRTDVDGSTLWAKEFDEALFEYAHAAIETEDRGFLIVGEITSSLTESPDVFLLKISQSGKQEWTKRYAMPGTQRGSDIVKAVDGGYMIVGRTRDAAEESEDDVLLVKVGENGDLIWSKAYGSEKKEIGNAIIAHKNGYVFIGSADNELPNTIDDDIILYRVDAQGNIVWDKRIAETPEKEEGNDIITTRDGGFAIAGTIGYNSDALVVKFNSEDNIQWVRTFGGVFGEEAHAIVELSDESLIITGLVEVDAINIDVYLVKIDKSGEKIWATNLGESKRTDLGEDVVATYDGGFAITGYTALGSQSFINDIILIKTDGGGNTITNYISGKAFYDKDGACDMDLVDTPLKEWLVKVTKTTGGNNIYFGTTNENGEYRILVDTGRYNVQVLPASNYWQSCITEGYNITLNNFYDTTRLDFPVAADRACPYLEVDISTPFLAACADIEYTVAYCNLGTATAGNAYVEVQLDDKLTFISSGIAAANQQGNKYTFLLGDLEATECGSFKIQTQMACEGIAEGQSGLVSAHIYPDTVCLEPGPEWDGSSIIVNGTCEQDTVKFFLKNVGRGDMSRPSRYYVVEDIVMLQQSNFQLGAGQEEQVFIKNSEGATYRIIAEQTDDHPGRSYPTLAIEGCVEDGQTFTTGYVTTFPENDQDNFIDIDVQETVGSISTVEMRGYPKGYDGSLIAANTDITYKIVFKNTGTNTVNKVVIRDTLSPYLDIATLLPGTSSHPYTFEVYGNGILKITFDNIELLPDGGTNETSNWGFVNFRVAQKPNNPTGTIFTNSAAIYFDFDAPAFTNEVLYEVGVFPDFVITGITGPTFIPGFEINIRPNPFMESAVFTIEGRTFDKVGFEIFDIAGRLVYTTQFSGNQFEYRRGYNLMPGMYVFKLQSEGQPIGSGKLMVR